MTHPAWQRIVNRIARREAALDAAGRRRGPTANELLDEIQRKTLQISGRCSECGGDLPASFHVVMGELGGRYALCEGCYEGYMAKQVAERTWSQR